MTSDGRSACNHHWGFHCSLAEEGPPDQQIPVKCMLCGSEDSWTRSQCIDAIVSMLLNHAREQKRLSLAALMN
jgi:hypothetical protein